MNQEFLCTDVLHHIFTLVDNLTLLTARRVCCVFLEIADKEIQGRLNKHHLHFGVVSSAYNYLAESVHESSHLNVILSEIDLVIKFAIFQNTLMFCLKRLICSKLKIIGLLWYQYDQSTFEEDEIYWLKFFDRHFKTQKASFNPILLRNSWLRAKDDKAKIFSTFVHLSIKGKDAKQWIRKYDDVSGNNILLFRQDNERLLSYCLKFSTPAVFEKTVYRLNYKAPVHILKYLRQPHIESAFFHQEITRDEIFDFGRFVFCDDETKMKLKNIDAKVLKELLKLSFSQIHQIQERSEWLTKLKSEDQVNSVRKLRVLCSLETPQSWKLWCHYQTSLNALTRAYEF